MTPKAKRGRPAVSTPPERFQEVVWALKGLNAGTADAGQQALALHWILYKVCKLDDSPYFPDNSRDTDFALGKQFVARCIAGVINMDLGAAAQLPKLGPSTSGEDDEMPNF